MAEVDSELLKTIEGIESVDPSELADFKREMTDHVIPEIVRMIKARQVRAAESRHWQLKC